MSRALALRRASDPCRDARDRQTLVVKTFLWITGALIAGIVLIAFVGYAGTHDTNHDTADPAMNAQQRRDMTTLIQRLGYHCPAANLALAQGGDVGGTVVKVWCGPPGTTDVYQNLVFRVTTRPDGSSSVVPWQ
jgi:hypothetical protein